MDSKKQKARRRISRKSPQIAKDQVKKRLRLDSDPASECSRGSSRTSSTSKKNEDNRSSRSRDNSTSKRIPTLGSFSLPEQNCRSNVNTSIKERVAEYSGLKGQTDLRDILSARKTNITVECYKSIHLLEGTIVDFHETYGFILVEATIADEIYNLTEDKRGRMFFKISPQLDGTSFAKFKVNDLVTFSLNIYNPAPSLTSQSSNVLDGQCRYEITNVSRRFKRSDDQIYTVNPKKRKIADTDEASTSTECRDAKKQRKSVPRLKVRGKVVTWNFEKKFCFVQPLSKLPEGVFKPENFFLHLSNLGALELSLVYGDNVEIFVNPDQAEKMRADRGVLTSLTPKGHSDVNKVVYETLLFLMKANSDQNFLVSQLYEPKPLLALFKYFLKIRGLQNLEEMNALFVIVRVLQLCATRCANQLSKEMLNSATEKGLFNKDGLFFKLFVSNPNPILELSEAFSENSPYEIEYNEQTSRMNADQVFKVLLKCVELYPGCSRKIHNLIAPRVSICGSETLLGLVRILSQPYAKRADILHREVKLVPTNEELEQFILSEKSHLQLSNLRPVIERGPYESVEGYIETYFNLLRFDCFYNFLVGLKKYVQGKHDSRDISVYKNGSLIGIGLHNQSAAITFTVAAYLETKLSADKVKIERYFQNGNLVALFPAQASLVDPIWTTVNCRGKILPDGSLPANLIFSKDANNRTFLECFRMLVENNGNFLLIESPTYYLSYWPVLKALQILEPDELPFQEELVKGQPGDDLLYSQESPLVSDEAESDYEDDDDVANGTIGITKSALDDNLHDVKKKDVISDCIPGDVVLDASQNDAMQLILKNRVAVVQGPPGTGKTFVGVQAVKTLLSMKNSWGDPLIEGPILVLTYKNHALDEFSKHIIKDAFASNPYRNNFIRVGGQSKDESMRQYSIQSALQRASFIETQQKQDLELISEELLNEFEDFKTSCSVLDMDVLKKHLTPEQIANLIGVFVSRNRDFLSEFQFLVSHFGELQNMAVRLSELLDKREHHPAIDRLESLFTQALTTWMPDNEFVSKFIELERKKQIAQQQMLVKKLTESVTDENLRDTELNEDTELDEKGAEDRLDISMHGKDGTALINFREFEMNNGKSDEENLCLCHNGVLTKLLASRVSLADFKYNSLFEMSFLERFQFLQAMLFKQCEVASSKLKTSFDQFEALAVQVRKSTLSREVQVLVDAKLVAMTITGAAIRNEVLNLVKPSVIIVEEAAEISEAHLMALLGSHVKHLILIGDHKQLPPQVECYDLVKKYHFDISMMERLINNNLPYATLSTQNRMRPDISKYLLDIYPELKDNKRVLLNPKVIGIQKNCFFWNHDFREETGRSPVNRAEAKAAIDLANYLCQFNEYSLAQITILSGYKGQTALLRKMAKNEKNQEERLDIQTIDMFQGDENDIVIVSTTRNNSEKNPGFMGILNRRCVAQSRGKSGVYFLGNAETLNVIKNQRKKTSVWSAFFQALETDDALGEDLVLQCQYHEGVTKELKVGDVFPSKEEPFCPEKCSFKMSCGVHQCKRDCQPYHKKKHSHCEEIVDFEYNCGKHSSTEKCHVNKKQLVCRNSCEYKFHTDENSADEIHACPLNCEPAHLHEKCNTEVVFSCPKNDHPMIRKCWQDPSSLLCEATISFVFSFCGKHTGEAKCYEDETQKKCYNVCWKKMEPCDHPCNKNCEPEHDHDSMACLFRIDYCCSQCGGKKRRMCFQNDSDINCLKYVQFVYPKCGRHNGRRKCYQKLEDMVCPNRCDYQLPDCSHLCKKPCSEEHSHCPDAHKCEDDVLFQHRCGQILTRLCWQPEEKILCQGPCRQFLKCQHKCPLLCDPPHDHEANSAIICREKMNAHCENCGSILSKLCFEELDSSKCSADVKFKHSCGYLLSRPCNKSEKQIVCSGPCKKKLKCGHCCAKACGSKHDHDYDCLTKVKFSCKSCSKILEKKCCEDENNIKCFGTMRHLCSKCNVESSGPCDRSDRTFECRSTCVQILKCGHKCSVMCFEKCSDSNCRKCLDEQRKKERLERHEREAQKRREIEAKRVELRQELQRFPHKCQRGVSQYKLNPEGDDSAKFFEVTDMVMKYLKVRKGYMPKINSVYIVSNYWGKKCMAEAQLELNDPTNKKSMCFFTTDGRRRVEELVMNGFKKRFFQERRNHYGRHSEPTNLVFTSRSPEVRFKSEDFHFTVLVCDVLVGRAKTVKYLCDVRKQLDPRFDSIFYPGTNDEEVPCHFIYNHSHVVITERVEFTVEPIKSLSADGFLKDGTFQKIELEPRRKFLINDEKQHYCRMALTQYFAGCRDKSRSIESIKSIHLFFNPDLEAKFDEKQADIKEKYKNSKYNEEILAFHGTSIPDPEIIMKENFRLDKINRTMHGYGIYFSEYVSTSMDYTENTGQLILVRVLLGKSEESRKCRSMASEDKMCEEHDSHTVSPSEKGHAKMVIIQNTDQILPMFIIRTK